MTACGGGGGSNGSDNSPEPELPDESDDDAPITASGFWDTQYYILKADKEAHIDFAGDLDGVTHVDLYFSDDRLGNKQLTLFAENVSVDDGYFEATWDTTNVPEGIYSIHWRPAGSPAIEEEAHPYDGHLEISFVDLPPTLIELPELHIDIRDGDAATSQVVLHDDQEITFTSSVSVEENGDLLLDLVLKDSSGNAYGYGLGIAGIRSTGFVTSDLSVPQGYILNLRDGEQRGLLNGQWRAIEHADHAAASTQSVSLKQPWRPSLSALHDNPISDSSGNLTKSLGSVSVAHQTIENPVYYGDIEVILQDNCQVCHQPDGGGIPIFYDYATTAAVKDLITFNVRHNGRADNVGYMPPNFVAGSSDDASLIEDFLGLTEAEINRIQLWVENGAPEGETGQSRAFEVEIPAVEGTPDWTARVPDFTPGDFLQNGETDLYRCFLFDPQLTTKRYVKASEVIPGNPRIDHHVIIYAIAPDLAAAIQEYADSIPGEGYNCFGGPLPDEIINASVDLSSGQVNLASGIGGWAPGAVPNEYEQAGILLEPGTLISVQMHYNLPQPNDQDASEVRLWFTQGEPRELIQIIPVVDLDLYIPAGDSYHIEGQSYGAIGFGSLFIDDYFSTNFDLMMIGATPHQHYLGKEISLEIARTDGSVEEVLYLPRWNFEWQTIYRYKDPIEIHPGDRFRVECIYDNSTGNPWQPLLTPVDVTWGDGSSDEMCIVFATMSWPNPNYANP